MAVFVIRRPPGEGHVGCIMKFRLFLLIFLTFLGCNRPSDTSIDWQEFATKWKNASIQEKKEMTDLFPIHEKFQSKEEKSVIAIFGSPSFKGQNKFSQYEVRYDFDPVPETDGRIIQHLSFIIERNKVVRVEVFILPE